MNDPNDASRHADDELRALQQAIGELAGRLGVDLADRRRLRALLDGDEIGIARNAAEANDATEADTLAALRELLVLSLRLEACSSEDLGVSGVRRLWQRCGELRARLALALAPQPPQAMPA